MPSAALTEAREQARFYYDRAVEAQRRVERLEAALTALKRAVEDVDGTLTREDDGEWVRVYVMPAGPWHRLLGLARS